MVERPSINLYWNQCDFTDDEEEYLAIERNTDEDVGWMKIDYRYLMPTCYSYLRDPNFWAVTYARPPYMISL
jgi:hypothetical protein